MLEHFISWFNINPIGQTIGFIAYVCTAISLLQKNDLKLRILMAVSAVIWSAHFFLIGAVTAGIMVSIIAIRTTISALSYNFSYRTKKILTIFFILINTFGLFFTWHGYVSILSYFSASLATVSLFLLSGTKMRLTLVLVEISWLIHNVLSLSIGGILSNLTNISILTTRIFLDKKRKFT